MSKPCSEPENLNVTILVSQSAHNITLRLKKKYFHESQKVDFPYILCLSKYKRAQFPSKVQNFSLDPNISHEVASQILNISHHVHTDITHPTSSSTTLGSSADLNLV